MAIVVTMVKSRESRSISLGSSKHFTELSGENSRKSLSDILMVATVVAVEDFERLKCVVTKNKEFGMEAGETRKIPFSVENSCIALCNAAIVL